MIVFDLACDEGHRFEGWFGSSDDFASQGERGLLSCPECGSLTVKKAPMAPAVPAKGNTKSREIVPAADRSVSKGPVPEELAKAMTKLAEAQSKALKDSEWVGDKFAETSRAMHYGEKDETPIHGKASVKEARALAEEGIAVVPLPFPVAPPEETN